MRNAQMLHLFNCYFRTCSDAECFEKEKGPKTTHAGGSVQIDDSIKKY